MVEASPLSAQPLNARASRLPSRRLHSTAFDPCQVPDEWEEEEAIEHIADLFRRPALSEDAWLLLPAQPAP